MSDRNQNGNSLFARHAYLPDGWAHDVHLEWDDGGSLVAVQAETTPLADEPVEQIVLPGMINLHSHSFQRAMAGLTEVAGDGPDSFWTWRDLMYRFARHITPVHMEAIAAQLQIECLRHGYTSICEFHYIHRQPDGQWYPRMSQTADSILDAAQRTGIGLTMLPVLYSYANFGEQPLRAEQNRFASSVPEILHLLRQLETRRSDQVEIGVAPHSLRAASLAQIRELLQALPAGRPVHIHIAEQIKEVNDCISFCGKRPVQWLIDEIGLDERWTLVHATHLTGQEIDAVARSGAVVGLCPSTEANLGDGLFELPPFLAQGGRFGIGSDSHVSTSPVEELRWLEYGQRLEHQRRNMTVLPGQKRVAEVLWQQALQGGAQASGRSVGALMPGKRADLLVLDSDHPNLFDCAHEDLLARFLFGGNDNLVRDVMVGGQWKVRFGRHAAQAQIAADYKKTLQTLRALQAKTG